MENDTRSKLIEIATQLFATKGYAAVSVREVTLAAQTNVSAISYYFNGKEGLYQAVLTEQLSPIIEALQSAQSNDSFSPIERLTCYADQIVQIHAQKPFLVRFMVGEAVTPTECSGPAIEDYLAQLHQFLGTALQEGIIKGDFRADLNITYAVISLAGILNFYFITKPLVRKVIPLFEHANSGAEYIAHAFRVYLHGIIDPASNCLP